MSALVVNERDLANNANPYTQSTPSEGLSYKRGPFTGASVVTTGYRFLIHCHFEVSQIYIWGLRVGEKKWYSVSQKFKKDMAQK